MAKRIVLAGVLAGLVMYAWSSLWHVVFGFGATGIKQIPNEDVVLSAMRLTIQEPGFYFFPGFDESAKMTQEQEQAWQQKYMSGPAGIMIYQPRGGLPLSPAQLLTECGKDIVIALVLAVLMAHALPGLTGFSARVLFVTLVGVVAGLETNVSYWNWYRFPGNYTGVAILESVTSFALGGLVLAALLKRRPAGFDVSSAVKSG